MNFLLKTSLQTLSDSLANILDQDLVVDSRYTPMFDVELESNTPLPYNHILDAKLNLNYKANVSQLSTKVNSLFNQNISQIVQPSSPGAAHGGNLVTDFTHINRIAENKTTLYEIVADKLDGAFESFLFLSNLYCFPFNLLLRLLTLSLTLFGDAFIIP